MLLQDVSAEGLPGLDVTAEADAAPAAGQADGAASGQADLGARSAKEKSTKKKNKKKKKTSESGTACWSLQTAPLLAQSLWL